MRGFTFLPRRVPINAPDIKLEDSKELDHEFETWGARAVILGIAGEFALALVFREHKTVFENWGPVAADALIGLGIVAEVHFAAQAGEKSEELRRRAIDRLAKSESSLQAVTVKLLLAEAKLEPRRLSPKETKIIADKIQGAIKHKVNFVIEQNDKANAFAWSIIAALKEGGAMVGPLPYKMPPGEKLMCPVMIHCPGGNMSTDDPLHQAFVASGIGVGTTSLTTLSMEMPMPTPSDLRNGFSPLPTGSRLPSDEYVVWVGEQSAFDNQSELIRRFEEAVGPAHQT